MQPDKKLIKQHIEFVLQGMEDYADGFFEIAYGNETNVPNMAEKFTFDKINEAVEFAAKKNADGRNVYVVGSILDPDSVPFGRCSDMDFYACNAVWCDIDKKIDHSELRLRYEKLPPSMVIVTGRTPHLRTHLWWKLAEPCTDAETLREMLSGIANTIGGDLAVCNPARLMRLGGTIAWPKKEGRVTELTEIIIPATATKETTIEAVLRNFPDNYMHVTNASTNTEITTQAINPFTEAVTDGRERYMSDMLYAAIVNLTAELGRWPTAQEVFDDAWPVYSRKVGTRNGRSLDQDGRGQKLMVSKIKSKLSAFQRGKMRGLETVETITAKKAKPDTPEPRTEPQEQIVDETTGEIVNAPQSHLLPYTWAYDVSPKLDANTIIEGLLGAGQFSVIYGESNCGKTFFATDLAFHIASGQLWRNKRTDQGGVVYVALEGGYGLHNRVAAYMQENPEAARGMPFAIITTQIDFLDPEGKIGPFIDTVRDVAAKVGNVKFIVIDTLARAISGGDENSSQDMGRLVAHADMIRAATDAHVCFIHHSGKDRAKGARGHSSLRAAVDTEIEIHRNEGDNYSSVKIVKQRDMEINAEMYFSLKPVSLGVNKHNEEVKSCTVEVIDAPQRQAKRDDNLTPAQQFVYDQINNCLAQSGKDFVSYAELAAQLEAQGWLESVPADKVKDRTKSVRESLRKKNKIGFDGGNIWLIKS